MPDFFVITDGDGTTAILPLSRLPADTTTGERVTIDVHATNGTAANQKAFMPESLPQGSTIRHVLTVADVAYSPSRAPPGPLHRASRQQRASAAASGKASTIACNSARVSSGLVGGVMCSGYGAVSSGARCSGIVCSFRATGGVCRYAPSIPALASVCHLTLCDAPHGSRVIASLSRAAQNAVLVYVHRERAGVGRRFNQGAATCPVCPCLPGAPLLPASRPR